MATELAYRQIAAQGASGFGILIALYDTLAGDLRRAADADRINDLEKRGEAVKHALLVVAHLEDFLSKGSGGELACQLAAFYRSLRHSMLVAQAKRSPELLEQQIGQILGIRQIWQDKDSRSTAQDEIPEWIAEATFPVGMTGQLETRSCGWTA